MNDKLILFGTGNISKYYTELLRQLSVEITGYADNDLSKWETYFCGKKINRPDNLKKMENLKILIACSDTETITEQLSQMKLADRIVFKEHVIRKGIEGLKIEKKYLSPEYSEHDSSRGNMIIIDNFHGSWGGAEDWAHTVSLRLRGKGCQVCLIESTKQKAPDELKNITFQIEQKGYRSVYMELVEWLMSKRPFTLINIWGAEVLWAAFSIKSVYPQDVRIITSVLTDDASLHRDQCEWDDFIDAYLCISSRIRDKRIRLYGIDAKKVYHKTPFIETINNSAREYELDKEKPLKIAYPCRLERTQKRADLLPELINELQTRHVNYVLNVVGEGSCKKEIMEYVDENNLHNNVKFYGRLSKTDLITFLGKQDIYLNFSEFEGTSLTMLEAMANGCVPVVTDVSGVDDFVSDGENGFISDIGDIKDMADNILYLDNNREKIKGYGKKSAGIVREKCNIDEYISYIERLVN